MHASYRLSVAGELQDTSDLRKVSDSRRTQKIVLVC